MSIDADALRALLAKVEKAKGGSRELDREIHTALGFAIGKVIHDGPLWNSYTTSIDAALALVAKVLPGTVRPGFIQQPMGHWRCAILRVEPDESPTPHCDAATAPIAILAALLRALLQQSETAHVER